MKKLFFKSVSLLMISIAFLGCSSDSNDTPTPVPVAKTKVSITRIDITQIPTNNSNGFAWDTASAPDVYIKLYDETNILGYTSNYVTNAVPSISNPLSVSFTNLTSTNLITGQLKVQVWDDDLHDFPSSQDQKIGEVPFYLNDYTIGSNKYPAFAVKNVNGTIITIYMTWE